MSNGKNNSLRGYRGVHKRRKTKAHPDTARMPNIAGCSHHSASLRGGSATTMKPLQFANGPATDTVDGKVTLQL
jgi:hypothetical protein